MVVFDFDKTLTVKDTVFDFFIFCSKMNKTFAYINYFIYLFIMILCKINIVSNKRLKKIGIYLFLSKIKFNDLDNFVKLFSKSIKLNYKVVEIFNRYPTKGINLS